MNENKDYINIKIRSKIFTQRSEYSKLMAFDETEGTIEEVEPGKSTEYVKNLIEDFTKLNTNPFNYFTITENKDYVILEDYIGKDLDNVIIPPEINNKKVKLTSSIFYNKSGVKNIILQNEITELPERFCVQMPDLETVFISPKTKIIPEECFARCKKLNYVNTNKVDIIDNFAFEDCENLAFINLDKAKEIGVSAFLSCHSLLSIKLPNIKNIYEGAFENCSNIKNLEIGNNLTYIDSYAFKDCKNLDKIILSDNLITIGVGAFMSCTNITQINFPETLKIILSDAFLETGLKDTLTFPKELEAIEYNAFYNTKITSITISTQTKYETNSFPLDALVNINFYEEDKKNKTTEEKEINR